MRNELKRLEGIYLELEDKALKTDCKCLERHYVNQMLYILEEINKYSNKG